ncbi:MAG: NADH-quinone oxidoreductase subunit N, partial [Actinobacteria bacterium]|nr:NADH-quinone oxidoreductase subunit N [Actinomycetota bacterium]
MQFTSPVLDYALLAPMLIILGGAIIGVLIEAFLSSALRLPAQLFISVMAIVTSLLSLIVVRDRVSVSAAMKSITFDGAGVLLQGSILIIALLSIFLIADQTNFTAAAATVPGSAEEREAHFAQSRTTEVFPLTLFAVAGMMLFTVASDLITLFVALEVLSLPLYLMAGLARNRRLASQEAALKYFLLG